MIAYGLITQRATVFGHALEGAPIGLGNIFGSNQHTFQKAIDIAFFGQGYSNGFELIDSAEQVIGVVHRHIFIVPNSSFCAHLLASKISIKLLINATGD